MRGGLTSIDCSDAASSPAAMVEAHGVTMPVGSNAHGCLTDSPIASCADPVFFAFSRCLPRVAAVGAADRHLRIAPLAERRGSCDGPGRRSRLALRAIPARLSALHSHMESRYHRGRARA